MSTRRTRKTAQTAAMASGSFLSWSLSGVLAATADDDERLRDMRAAAEARVRDLGTAGVVAEQTRRRAERLARSRPRTQRLLAEARAAGRLPHPTPKEHP